LTGAKVWIELIKSSNLTDHTSTEVWGKKPDDGVNSNDANSIGRLSIIEAEMYEQVNNL
jgi:hypothetical protein